MLQKLSYHELEARKKAEYGDKFDASDLSQQFVPYYESQQRIEVDLVGLDKDGKDCWGHEIRRGTVGVTTGWKPCFILMARKSNYGSGTTLSDRDHILKIIS